VRRWLSVLLVLGLIGGCASGEGTMPPSAAPSATPGTLPSRDPSPHDSQTDATLGAPASPAPSTFPTPAVSAAPTLPADVTPHGWVERARFPGESLDVLVPGGPGLIAAGSRRSADAGDPGDALILLSADGSAWRTAAIEGSSGGSIDVIRRVNGSYVALGTRLLGEADFRGAVWTSTDAERWALEATFPMLVPRDIVERDGHLHAWGTGGWTEPSGLFVWTLDAAGRWSAARQIDSPEEAFLARGVIAAPGGYLVFGGRGGVLPAVAAHAFVGTSADGMTWRFAPAQATLAQAGMVAVVPRSDGYLALGWALADDGTSAPAVWHSVDGLAWDRVPSSSGLTGGRLTGAALAGDRVLARGTIDEGQQSRAVSWESLDGISWTRLPLGADIHDLVGTTPSAPVTYGGQRLAVATFQDGSTTRAVILVKVAASP
jgi:hypothetical protein